MSSSGDDDGTLSRLRVLEAYVGELIALAKFFGTNPVGRLGQVVGTLLAAVAIIMARTTAGFVESATTALATAYRAIGDGGGELGDVVLAAHRQLVDLNNQVLLGLVDATGPFAAPIVAGLIALELALLGVVLKRALEALLTAIGGINP
ncbi:hypothetical protein G9C85_00175 [Halorubellus sp. JP-L1]|uniref:hypothetical protein n=1 Tax=Halorubellus sp. JP-L1 TaxID=2715753 RepID=UPI00140AC78C|nr:hypothetical protein [Halorubellus sp. JP-L1]NHN40054.1 hypothetical protein [Halorubellus sp. JP-L1]